MLYIVPTPIGNLDDITLRALNTLFSVDVILCEDTRKTFFLLKHFQKKEIKIPTLISYYEEIEVERIPKVIKMLKDGKEIALVTNAGTPTISDPGFKLVRECIKQGIKVTSLPGPFAPAVALSASGLPTDKFLFLGFLPSKLSQKINLFKNVQKSQEIISSTIVFFESPYKLIKTLESLKSVFGDIRIVIARELTKVFEEIKNEKISSILEYYSKNEPKGEFVVLFNLKENE